MERVYGAFWGYVYKLVCRHSRHNRTTETTGTTEATTTTTTTMMLAYLSVCWPYVGRISTYVGRMLAYLSVCWPHVALVLAHVGLCWAYLARKRSPEESFWMQGGCKAWGVGVCWRFVGIY